jgi:hypothetical protein
MSVEHLTVTGAKKKDPEEEEEVVTPEFITYADAWVNFMADTATTSDARHLSDAVTVHSCVFPTSLSKAER